MQPFDISPEALEKCDREELMKLEEQAREYEDRGESIPERILECLILYRDYLEENSLT